jgi:dolichol-phosphate mannosyltransferase
LGRDGISIVARSLVIIPTFNEIENVEKVIRHVLSLPYNFDILIVDDASPDGTARVVKDKQMEYPDRLFLEERRGKLGLGTAYIHGYRWALEREYQFIFNMDADLSHNPDDLSQLFVACNDEGIDMVIGSRYLCGVNVVNWPLHRILMSYFAARYVRLVTRMPIKDPTSGFICYRKRVLEKLDLDTVTFTGYGFLIQMKFLTWKHGFKIKEVPIVFTERTKGKSKMSAQIFNEALWGVILMKIRSLFKKYE